MSPTPAPLPASSPRATPQPRWPVVVFDLDGTLVDTIHLIVESYQHSFRTHLGHDLDPALIRSWIGRPLINAFRGVDAERADTMFATYIEWNRANTDRLIGRYEGIGDMLTTITAAGMRVGVATSKLRAPALIALEHAGLVEFADVLITLEDTAAHKPDPAPLLCALDRLGSAPSDAVYVGDAAVDLRAAAAAGMAGVGVTWGAGERVDLEGQPRVALADTAPELTAILLGSDPDRA